MRTITDTSKIGTQKRLIKFINERTDNNRRAKWWMNELGLDAEALYELLAEEYNKEVKAQQLRKKELKKLNTEYKPIFDYTITERNLFNVERQLKNVIQNNLVNGDMVNLQITQNGQVYKSEIYDVRGGDAMAIYWNSFYPYFVAEGSGGQNISNGNLINTEPLISSRVVIWKSKNIIPNRIKQNYRDGANYHCVFDPIYNKLMADAGGDVSVSTKKKYIQIANRVLAMKNEYKNEPIPEDDMEKLADKIQRKIIINNITQSVLSVYGAKYSKIIELTNSRPNHVEYGAITLNHLPISKTQDELNSMAQELGENDKFYWHKKNGSDYTYIQSCEGTYSLYNENYDIFKKFNEEIGLKQYGYNSIANREMHEFIQEAVIVNSCPTALCDNPNDDDVKHCDLSKAYTLHKLCKYYAGFLGMIHQYRKFTEFVSIDFLKNHIGIYQFEIVKTCKLAKQLGLYEKKVYILPSVEILYFVNVMGMTVKILAGVFGSSFDFDYNDEMLENRRYCYWAGKLGMENEYNILQCHGTQEWAEHLYSQDVNIKYFDGTVIFKQPKKSNRVYHHIFAFITSYTRINMYETMRAVEGQLVKVILDGIYYKGSLKTDLPHQDKEIKKHDYFKDFWFSPTTQVFDFSRYNNMAVNTVLIGQGGSGKTYSVLTDKGFINMLYVAPTNSLAFKTRETYNVNSCTLHRLIGEGCVSYKDQFNTPSVILIDELTMCEKHMINKAIQMYSKSLIFIAGDIDKNGLWYQCRNGDDGRLNELWTGDGFVFKEYKNDRRALDDDLKKMKLAVREEMRNVFTNGLVEDAHKINMFVRDNYKVVEFKDAVNMHKEGDIWISGTHNTNDILLNKNITSGYIDNHKEINFIGEGRRRGSFTIHSFQGITIENKRVFIVLDLFEYAMLYTAISRVRNYSQIVFVNPF